MNLRNKTAIITGGTKGIGKAIAENLLYEDANIVVAARTESELANIKSQFKTKDNFMAIKCDVTSIDDVKELMKKTLSTYETIDILVNNVGKAYIGPISKMSNNDWNDIITTNLTSVFLCCKEVIPIMEKQKSGYIINIVSNSGKSGTANFAAYCASKFGEIGFTQSLFQEVKASGIKVVAICPGGVDTTLWKNVQDDPRIIPKKGKSMSAKNVAQVVNFILNNDEIIFVEPLFLPSSLYY